MKPNMMKVRFPPVLDKFSRTIAAPVSEIKLNLNPSGRIGSNFTPSNNIIIFKIFLIIIGAKFFYIDAKDKKIRNLKATNMVSF